jgi:hypothetical protein
MASQRGRLPPKLALQAAAASATARPTPRIESTVTIDVSHAISRTSSSQTRHMTLLHRKDSEATSWRGIGSPAQFGKIRGSGRGDLGLDLARDTARAPYGRAGVRSGSAALFRSERRCMLRGHRAAGVADHAVVDGHVLRPKLTLSDVVHRQYPPFAGQRRHSPRQRKS